MNGWRPMVVSDIARVKAISDTVHGIYTEGMDIYAERLALYPAGCCVLDQAEGVQGYLLSHPWRGRAPALDVLLGVIPAQPDRYYLHDIALMPSVRGIGAAAQAIELVVEQARACGFDRIALIAVNGAEGFWLKQGFTPSGSQGAGYGDSAVSMERKLSD